MDRTQQLSLPYRAQHSNFASIRQITGPMLQFRHKPWIICGAHNSGHPILYRHSYAYIFGILPYIFRLVTGCFSREYIVHKVARILSV